MAKDSYILDYQNNIVYLMKKYINLSKRKA